MAGRKGQNTLLVRSPLRLVWGSCEGRRSPCRQCERCERVWTIVVPLCLRPGTRARVGCCPAGLVGLGAKVGLGVGDGLGWLVQGLAVH